MPTGSGWPSTMEFAYWFGTSLTKSRRPVVPTRSLIYVGVRGARQLDRDAVAALGLDVRLGHTGGAFTRFSMIRG